MKFKNIQIILIFITYVSFVLSLPINDDIIKFTKSIQRIKATETIQTVDKNIKVTEFRGDDLVDTVLEVGGFDNDKDLMGFILNEMGYQNMTNIFLNNKDMGCSAFQTTNEKGNGFYFGRNYDFPDCDALIFVNRPDHGYSSISTVDPDLISWVAEDLPIEETLEKAYSNQDFSTKLPDEIIRLLSIYIPLDGINEKGLSISTNILYNSPINQNTTGLVYLTSLSLIRVLLDKAATVDEAIEIVKNINLNTSFGIDEHYLISDATGKSVSIEYINNEMVVTEAKIITNFYIAKEREGEGIGQDRYEKIQQMIDKYPNMNLENARDTLEACSKNNTQWSVVYDQSNLEATYYIRKNYEKEYLIKLFDDDNDWENETIVGIDIEDLIEENSDSCDETETENI